jgi:hypothetical protein
VYFTRSGIKIQSTFQIQSQYATKRSSDKDLCCFVYRLRLVRGISSFGKTRDRNVTLDRKTIEPVQGRAAWCLSASQIQNEQRCDLCDLELGEREMRLAGIVLVGILAAAQGPVHAQNAAYDGLGNGIGSVYRLSNAKTYSISPENPTGEKGKGGMATSGSASGAARELGRGWKVNPFVVVGPGQTFTLAEINGAGAIQHIWMTPTGDWRRFQF